MSVLKTYGDDNVSFKPSLTYRINGEHISGKMNGIDAVKQAVYLILSTERFKELVFSWDYGLELSDLFGKDRSYIEADLQRRFSDALLQDDRVIGIERFKSDFIGDEMQVSFAVTTLFGEIGIERVVSVG